MDEYELSSQFQTSNGKTVKIVIDEDVMSIVVYTLGGKKIGNIDLGERDGDYHILWMYLDQLNSDYVRKGIGRAALKFFKETYRCGLTASADNGLTLDDGSHLTGDAPGFVAQMRHEGIIKETENYD